MMLDVVLSAVSVVLAVRLVALLGLAGWNVLQRRRAPTTGVLPSVTVLVPAHNEQTVIAGTVRALLASDHPNMSVLVIDDGSTDDTASVVQALIDDGHRRLQLRCLSHNQGKAAALNAGLETINSAHVATVDADTLVAADALSQLCVTLMAARADAAASNVKVGNRINMLTRWQAVEYIVGLNLVRRAQHVLGCITTIPGAACVFLPDALTAVGGFSADTVVEDTDLTLSLLQQRRRIVYVPTAVAYTEAPVNWLGLFRQRRRWMHGYLQCLWKHRRAFLRRDVLGMFGMPNLLLVHVLLYLLVPFSLPPLLHLFEWTGLWPFVWGVVGLFGVEIAIALWAHWVDDEPLQGVLHVPLRRLIWPWFLLVLFVWVWLQRLGGVSVGWGQPARQGSLAAAGPQVIRSADKAAKSTRTEGA